MYGKEAEGNIKRRRRKERYMKKILLLLISCVMIVFLVSCEKADSSENDTTITGKEWLMTQKDDFDTNYQKMIKSVEEIYSLYVAGKIDSKDFMTELELCQKELVYIRDDYFKKKSDKLVDYKDDYASQKGVEAMEQMFEDMNNLFVSSARNGKQPYTATEISYIYINYRDKIIEDYVTFQAAVKINESNSLSRIDSSSGDELREDSENK